MTCGDHMTRGDHRTYAVMNFQWAMLQGQRNEAA